MNQKAVISTLLIVTIVLTSTYGLSPLFPFSEADKARECYDMFPEGLRQDPSPEPAPFSFLELDTAVVTGGTHEIKIETKQGARIGGIYLQARESDCSARVLGKPLGTFSIRERSVEDKLLDVIDCGNFQKNTVVNKVYPMNVTFLAFSWKAPIKPVHVHFKATIVDDQGRFWLDIFSHDHVRVVKKGQQTNTPDLPEGLQLCPNKRKYFCKPGTVCDMSNSSRTTTYNLIALAISIFILALT